MSNPKKGCCGPLPNRIESIKNVSNMLSQGHFGLAEMYKGIADEIEDPKEKATLLGMVDLQRLLGSVSLQMVIPDEVPERENEEIVQ